MIDAALLITCPSCHSLFRMKREDVGHQGRPVRCTQCFCSWNLLPDGTNGGLLEDLPTAHDDVIMVDDKSVIDDKPMIEVSAPSLVPSKITPPFKAEKSLKIPRKVPKTVVIAAIIFIAGIGFFAGRETVLRSFPKSAAIYSAFGLETNLRGLEFRDVKGSRVMEKGMDILVIEGKIANISTGSKPVAALRLSVRDKKAKEVYHWSVNPTKATMEAGEEISFKARLASPPVEGADIAVRFMTDADIAKP